MDDQDDADAGARRAGEPCAECGAPLAADQRYCLNCGKRRGDPRVDYEEYLKNGATGAKPRRRRHPRRRPRSGRDWTPYALVGLVAAFGMMLELGVLIGRPETAPTQAAAPVVQVGAAATTRHRMARPTSANRSFESDWPSGKEGFTIEIGTLSKQGTTPSRSRPRSPRPAARARPMSAPSTPTSSGACPRATT